MIAAALLLVLGFMLSATTTISGDSISYSCDISSNYTDNSSYLANLKLLPTMLIQNASTNPSPFSMGCIGTVPDIVYGLFLCRVDVGEFDCKNCTATGFQDAQQLCWLNKDATVFYDQCLVYFSNTDFLDDVSSLGVDVGVIKRSMDGVLPGYDPNRPGNITHTNGIIKVLLQETAKQAAYNSTWRFATALMNAINLPPLYSLMQCVPYLTPSECWECLNNISEVALSRQAGYQFWPPFAPSNQILAVPCNLRYSTAQFYEGEPLLRIWSSPNADMAPVVMPNSPEHKRSKRKILVTAFVVPPLASIFCLILYFGFIRKHINGSRKRANMNLKEDEDLVWGLEGMSSEFTVYNFSQVQEATGNFSEENKLGQGGFGPVYKGQFPDGLEIAVKRLASHSGQGFTEFKNEIQLIAKLQHTNLVRLLGCCSQGEEKTLVYEYLPNKSLDFFIFDETRRSLLDWTTRRSIIEGIAQGLLYLHKHSRLRVIHRDLKTSNILLDHEMNPKISDFGLAKMFSTNETEGNTKRIVGTYGYMAPEYASEGLFSVKSDVFSFGVLILEIISGKRTSSFHGYGDFINLLGHAWQLWRDGLWLQLMDTSLVTEYHTLQMMRCINIALLCVQENVVDRPTMSHVVSMLSSESMSLPEPKHPAYFHIRVATEEISTVVQPSSLNELTVSALTGR